MMPSAAPGTCVVSHLESTLGLSFTGPRRARLLSSIEAQRLAAGLSEEDFLTAVSRPGRLHDRLVAEVTVGETYFFRDRAQCELLRDVVLPSVSAGHARVSMWSAGCASGEEAYTLAALAAEAGIADRCAVVGSDASSRAIDTARLAVYGPWSLRATTAAEKAAHFQQQAGQWEVTDQLRQQVRFVQRNLLDGPPPPGRFQVVLCRNLLIYLTRPAVRRAAEILTAALTPDGWLVTAAGDPPLDASGLESVRTRHGLAYRRAQPAASPDAARTHQPVAPARLPRSAQPPARRASVVQRAPTAPEAARPAAASAEQLAERVRSFGDAGRSDDACRTAIAAARAHPLDVELHYLAGVVLLEAGRLEEAAAAAASAVYLGPQLPAAHLLLGQVEHARGNAERARRSFRNGSRLLATIPQDEPVALSGDVPAGHLAAIATRYLNAHRTAR